MFYKPSEAAACLKSVPFDPNLRDHVLEVVTKFQNLAVFEYNQIDWPGPLAQNTDIRAELKRIGGQTYGSDYEFHLDLYNVFHSLRDGHHAWVSCYGGSFSTYQGLPLVSLAKDVSATETDSVQTSLFIVPNAADITRRLGLTKVYQDDHGIDAAELAGKEVTKIDGMDPWTYVDQIANTETGTYQDLGTRRSAALASYASNGADAGKLWVRDLGTIGKQNFPVRDTITYEVVISPGQTKTVEVPYFSYPAYNITTADAFFKENCLVGGKTGGGPGGTPVENPSRRSPLALGDIPSLSARDEDPAAPVCPPAVEKSLFPISNSPVNSSAYIGGRFSQFFVLPETGQGKVGVIYITTFAPPAPCAIAFVEEVALGIKNFTALGVERVIIDTTDDGGGSVLLSLVWQRIFSGAAFADKLGFTGVYRKADLYTAMSKASASQGLLAKDPVVGPGQLMDVDGKAFASDFQLYNEKGSELTINGHVMPVTPVVRDSDALVKQMIGQYLADSDKPAWPAGSVLIFSNGGTCGSACSLFTNFLNLQLDVKTHLSVARPDQPTEYSSFAAQVLTSDTFYGEIIATGLNSTSDPSFPPPLKVIGKFGFAGRGFYNPGTTDWLQYTSIPADKTFALTAEQYLDPLKMYAKAAESRWGTTSAKDDKPADVKGGVLGMSQSTTIKAAVGVGAAGVVGATGFIFFLIRRRSNRAKRGAYTEVAENTAPLGSFELPRVDKGRFD